MDEQKVMNVHKRDFFLHVFDELVAPESEMFMYNENKTLIWFPPSVSVDILHILILCSKPVEKLSSYLYDIIEYLFYVLTEQPKAKEKNYFLFGVLCGLALYNHNIVHLPFPLVLFKKLVRVKPSMEDMKEFDPVMAE